MPIQITSRDLTNKFISASYQDVVQRFDSGSTDYILDGRGYSIFTIPSASLGNNVITSDQTASYSVQAVSSSYPWASSGSSISYTDGTNPTVGIGTTSPTSVLHIVGSQFTHDRFGGAVQFALRTAKGTQSSPTEVSNGSSLGAISYQGYVSGSYFIGGTIRSDVDNTVSASVVPANIRFLTTNTSGVNTEAARFDSSQRFGIGITAPVTPLMVADTSSNTPRGIMSAQYSSNTGSAHFHGGKARGTVVSPTKIVSGDILCRLVGNGYDGTNFIESSDISMTSEGTVSSSRVPSRITFSTAADLTGSAITESMRITSGQQVGIGTTAPMELLDIGKGNLNFTYVTNPGSASVAAGAAGVLTGSYNYFVTFVTATGETNLGTSSAVINVSASQVNITNIPTSSDSRVTGRNIFRNKLGFPQNNNNYFLVTKINDNTSSAYTDNTADGALGPATSGSNTTAGFIAANGLRGFHFSDDGTMAIVGTYVRDAGNGSDFAQAGQPITIDMNWNPKFPNLTQYGIRASYTISGSSAITSVDYRSYSLSVSAQNTGNITGGVYGIKILNTLDSAITASTFYGITTGVRPTVAGASITSIYAYYAEQRISASGANVTNYRAFFSDDISPNATNSWGVYITGGKSYFGGNVGIGQTSPTAVLHIKAGTAAANTAPLKFTSGTNLTTAEAGTHEYNGNHYLTNANIRFPVGGTLFDHFTDTGSVSTNGTEDTLYTDTLAASTLANNGDKIQAEYILTYVSSSTATRRTRAYFGGTVILDSGNQIYPSASAGIIDFTIIRESSTVVRSKAQFTISGSTFQNLVNYTRITGLTLSNQQIVKVTGLATGSGAAAGDITASIGTIRFIPAA